MPYAISYLPRMPRAAVWLLELGDRAAAAERARKAMAEATPASAGVAAMVASLARAGGSPVAGTAEPLFQDYARVYALLIARDFRAVVPAIQEIYRRPTNDVDDGLAVLLAWAFEETGDWQKAEPLLRVNPLPQAAGLPMFSSLYFPRLFFLRGALLDKQGQDAEARRNYKLFLALSGPDRTIWGEEQRAAGR